MELELTDATLLALHSVTDAERGTLCVAEYGEHIPFEMKRIFYMYDLSADVVRGQHAHHKQDQFLVCLSGSVELLTIRKNKKQLFTLSHPREGVFFPAMTWVNIRALEASTICLVIASGVYDEGDYIRNFTDFEVFLNQK